MRHRHEQLGVVGVVQFQELGRSLAEVHHLQPAIAADAVLHVHHRVADLELRQVADHRLDVGGALARAIAVAARAGRVQLAFRQQHQACGRQREALLHRPHTERQRRVRGDEGVELAAVDDDDFDVLLREAGGLQDRARVVAQQLFGFRIAQHRQLHLLRDRFAGMDEQHGRRSCGGYTAPRR